MPTMQISVSKKVRPESLDALREALRQGANKLDLCHFANKDGSFWAHVIAIFSENANVNVHLKEVSFAGGQNLDNLRFLGIMHALSNYQNISTLDFSACGLTDAFPQDASPFSGFPRLEAVKLSENAVGRSLVPILFILPKNIVYLDLSETGIDLNNSLAIFQALSVFPWLQRLVLDNNPEIDGRVLRAFFQSRQNQQATQPPPTLNPFPPMQMWPMAPMAPMQMQPWFQPGQQTVGVAFSTNGQQHNVLGYNVQSDGRGRFGLFSGSETGGQVFTGQFGNGHSPG